MWVEQHKSKFRIRDLVGGKKVTVESGFPTKGIAKERKKRLEIEAIDLGPLKTGAASTPFEEWAEEWWTGHARTLKPNTARTEGSRFRRHVIGRLGHLPIGEIDEGAVRRWLNQLAQPEDADYDPLGPKSILNVHGYLHMVLERAVVERMIRSNPCVSSDLPDWEPPEMRFLTETELAEVMALVPVQWRPICFFIAATGCRVGEAIGLRQRSVDVLGQRVRFETQLRREGNTYVNAPLKTKASRRTIGFGPSLAGVLAERTSIDKDAYVFLGPGAGRPIFYDVLREVWKKSLEKTEYEGVRMHDLRHTHAAHLISKGRPLTSIQRRLGHSSIKVTSDVYGHLLPEVEDDTAAAVEEFVSQVDLAGIGGGIVGGNNGSERPATASDDPEGKKKPQVDADSAP